MHCTIPVSVILQQSLYLAETKINDALWVHMVWEQIYRLDDRNAGWQVTLCYPVWHVHSRGGEAYCRKLLYFTLLFTLPTQPEP